ncbi:hypothetical protein L9F63_007494, partial [Diploptera punctata]
MEDDEREDLLIRASSDNEELSDNEETFDATNGNIIEQENKINTLYETVRFISLALLLCVASTALIILLPLYQESVNIPGDAYTVLLFVSFTTLVFLFFATCIIGKFYNGIKASLSPPFAISTTIRIGIIYGISCFVIIYSLDRKKVICHLQDPIKGIILVFSLVYYFFFCRKMMSLQKIFCSTTIIVGLFISVDYGLCDEFRCRGNERQSRSEDAGDWSWKSHAIWTVSYIMGLALWTLQYTLLEGHLVTSGELFSKLPSGSGNARLATVSRLVSTRDCHSSSRRTRPLLQLPEDGQEAPLEQRSDKPHALTIAFWLHLVTAVLVASLFWTDMTSVLGKGSSAGEFWNLTRNGLHCHFAGFNSTVEARELETCQHVVTYAWPFVAAYILFVLTSLKFLIVSESAVFTVAMTTSALPLAGIWWSLFRMVGTVTLKTSELVQWHPVVTGELICSLLGLPIVLAGIVLLCKAHLKERSYGKVAIALFTNVSAQ